MTHGFAVMLEERQTPPWIRAGISDEIYLTLQPLSISPSSENNGDNLMQSLSGTGSRDWAAWELLCLITGDPDSPKLPTQAQIILLLPRLQGSLIPSSC